MRRIIITLCLFLAASPAMAANRYVDNRRAITGGTAQNSGSTTTTLKIASFTLLPNVAAANTDLVNMGINITAGTNAPASWVDFKITAVDNTDPAHPVLTVNAAFNGVNVPQDNWTFNVSYGSDANTTFNTATKAGTLTGPKRSIYGAYNNSSSNDVIYVKGGTDSVDYSDLVSFNSNGRNITVEGYLDTPGDLELPADVRASSITSAQFPYLNLATTNVTVSLSSALSSATSITLRRLRINNGASSGAAIRCDGAGASLAVHECLVGTADMPSNGMCFYDGTTAGVAKSFAFTKSTLFTENTWMVVASCGALTVDDCNLYANITGTPLHALILNSVEGNASSHILKATFNDIDMIYNGSSSTASMFVVTGLTHTNPLKLSNITATYNANGCWLVVPYGISNLLVENCNVTCTTTPTTQTMIGIGLDTQPVNHACGTYGIVLHSAAASAAGTGNISADGTTFVLSSTGSPSSVDDFYIDRFIRFPAQPSQRARRITDYVGATRTITIWGDFDAASTAPAYEIVKYERVSSSIIIRNNRLEFTAARSHNLLFGQGCDGALAENNTMLNGDYTMVVKSEDCRIIGNKCSGDVPMILKGASRNYVLHNTFYSNVDSTGVFEFSDKSPLVENLHGNGQFSKCSGNVIMNNILACKSDVSSPMIFEYMIGDGDWAEDSDDSPLRQNNRIDYNVYAMGDGPYFGDVDGGDIETFADWKAKLANIEADGLPYSKMYPLNDANSVAGTIVFRSPTTGDFTVIGGTAKNALGSDGQPIGAGRAGKSRIIYIP